MSSILGIHPNSEKAGITTQVIVLDELRELDPEPDKPSYAADDAPLSHKQIEKETKDLVADFDRKVRSRSRKPRGRKALVWQYCSPSFVRRTTNVWCR